MKRFKKIKMKTLVMYKMNADKIMMLKNLTFN